MIIHIKHKAADIIWETTMGSKINQGAKLSLRIIN